MIDKLFDLHYKIERETIMTINLRDLDAMIETKYADKKENVIVVDNTKHFKQSDNTNNLFSTLTLNADTDTNTRRCLFDNIETEKRNIYDANQSLTENVVNTCIIITTHSRRAFMLCLMRHCYDSNTAFDFLVASNCYDTYNKMFFNDKHFETTHLACCKSMISQLFKAYDLFDDTKKHYTNHTSHTTLVILREKKEKARL